MGFYVRMLSRGKWESIKDVQYAPADTLQSELKTTSNTLSLWYIDDIKEKDDAILALASGRSSIDRLDILCIKEELLEGFDLENHPETGLSPYFLFNKNHYDIQNVNYATIGEISKIILDELHLAERISKGTVQKMLIDGWKSNKLNSSIMESSLEIKLKEKIGI